MSTEEKEKFRVSWENIAKVLNNRKLTGEEITKRLRYLFEVEFFEDIININTIELNDRKERLKKENLIK